MVNQIGSTTKIYNIIVYFTAIRKIRASADDLFSFQIIFKHLIILYNFSSFNILKHFKIKQKTTNIIITVNSVLSKKRIYKVVLKQVLLTKLLKIVLYLFAYFTYIFCTN